MSVQICRHCALPYWRYRGDHPPKGFCSTPHRDQHTEQRRPKIKDHNRLIHDADSSMIAWDCKACERLQTEYAESLTFHFGRQVTA